MFEIDDRVMVDGFEGVIIETGYDEYVEEYEYEIDYGDETMWHYEYEIKKIPLKRGRQKKLIW